MIYPNFASVPDGNICRPVTIQKGDEYYWGDKEFYKHMSMRWDVWSGEWETRNPRKCEKTAKASRAKSDNVTKPRRAKR